MFNIYVEPEPKGRPDGSTITHYVLEFERGKRATDIDYEEKAEAIAAARKLGHKPVVARVRNTSKSNPNHWREA